MITIISCTNRPNSWTKKVTDVYISRLINKKVDFQFLDLQDLPADILSNEMYDIKSSLFSQIEMKYLVSASKFIFIIPEYNGSYPGILKLMIDASDIKKSYHNKKAALVGVADGRAGNLRGMDDFTNVLNYLRINVLHCKIPISSVSKQFDENGNFLSKETLSLIDQQIDLFSKM
ncbi:MAG: NAD(P)H-dependent oxidoreductase [Chitinophagales bacterium]|nr:NAD(P)H-dependent oxidoreductase [Chitinophagales bacterium]MCZ2394663.1 NAD(P)H-dependent oxidoreductase [Chitinophagales bacterium]